MKKRNETVKVNVDEFHTIWRSVTNKDNIDGSTKADDSNDVKKVNHRMVHKFDNEEADHDDEMRILTIAI